MAQDAGISGNSIYQIIREEVMPTDEIVAKMSKTLGVPAAEFYDPLRKNINIDKSAMIKNIKAIIAHHGIARSTYFVRNKMDSKTMHVVLETGDITAAQAHRIVEIEGCTFSVRELVSQNISERFTPAVEITPATVSRNLMSLTWEKGLYPAEIARNSGVCAATAINYAQGKSRRIDRELLAKVAQSLGISLAEIADPHREVVTPSPLFASNLNHLVLRSSLALTPIGESCGLETKVLHKLMAGVYPNPHQVAKLSNYFKVPPKALLMEDLSGSEE